MVRRRWISILLAALACVAMGWRISLAKGQATNTTSLKWQPTLDDAKRVAAQTNRLILVHFWAPSCRECVELEKNVYSQPNVQQAINARFVPLKLNSDDFPTTTRQYGVDRLPTDLIITPAGQIVGRMKCPLTPDAYLQQLNIAASGAGPASQFASAPPAAAPAASPPVANVAAAPPAAAPPLNAAPAQPPISPPLGALNSQQAAVNPPVMSNPAWAVQPPAQQARATRTSGRGGRAAGQNPANPAYSDDRYADYFRRFSPSGAVATTPAVATTAPVVQVPVASPVAAAMPQSRSAPPVASGMPQYTSPPANPVQYTSPAVAQNAVAGAAPQQNLSLSPTMAFAWPATPAPAMTAAAATQPYTGASIAGSPAATLTGVAATAPAITPGAAPTASPAAPPVGLDGYCPVTLADQKRWQVGDRRYGVIHRGRTYLFAGPVEQQKFLQNPDHYSPAISGQDVVMALDQGQTVDGQRQFGVEYQGRTYLFASDASRRAFSQNPKRYAAEVLQAENPNRPPLR